MANTTPRSPAVTEPCEIVQLALFGEPVPFNQTPDIREYMRSKRDDGPPPEVEDPDLSYMRAEMERWDQGVLMLLEGFEPAERERAQRLIYRDADGVPRTRHRMLSSA